LRHIYCKLSDYYSQMSNWLDRKRSS